MKTTKTTKGWALGLLALGLALVTGTAKAAYTGNPTGDDTIVVRITPNVLYGVQIDTANLQGVSAGVIDMGAL
ncbi:MAG: hypothetical protein KGL53_13140, partial [Elusimicrobia bacterium]|nr:hypothetical protein [Elusimicrobiota bacterium]